MRLGSFAAKNFMKNFCGWVLGAPILLLATDPCPACEDPCCPPPDPCAKCAQIWPTQGPDWIITPNAGPCVDRGWDAHIVADFIFWSVKEDQLCFALRESIQTLPDSQVTVTSKGTTYHPDWHFEPGFRIGIGVLKDHDGWDVFADYTWISVGSTKKSVSIDDLNTERLVFIGGFGDTPGIEQITKISGEWSLDFNVLELELGRNFFISRYLILRPFISLKGTWQDQSFEVTQTGIAEEFNVQDNAAKGLIDQHLHDWGVGIRAGLNMAWHFNPCWSLLGNIAATGLWEKFEVENQSTRSLLTFHEGSSPVTTLYVENDFSTIKPILEFLLALRYETWFCCESYHFSLAAGWEIQWWGDQNQFFETSQGSLLGDLTLTGLTLKFRLDF